MSTEPPFFKDMGIDNVIGRKSLYRLHVLQKYLSILGDAIPPIEEKEKWIPYLKDIVVRELLVKLRRELKEYKKKYPKSDYKSDIEKAKKYNGALFRIIEWDRTWLGEEWVLWKIIDAQEKGDLDFLKSLGDAISKKPQTRRQIKGVFKENRELCLAITQAYIMVARVKYPELTEPQIVKVWLGRMVKAGYEWFPAEFYDFAYFIKFLRRHGVIAWTRKT